MDGGWGYGEGMWNKDKSNLVGAMENGPFIDGLPIKNGDLKFSMAMLNNQMV